MLSLDRRRAFGPWFFIAIAAYIALYFNDVSYIFMDEQGDALATFAMAGSMGMVTYIPCLPRCRFRPPSAPTGTAALPTMPRCAPATGATC